MSRGEPGKSTPLLAVDTGGTFTDLLLLREGRLTALKLPSTPEDPAAAVLEGIGAILRADAGAPSSTDLPLRIVHGSTVGTNALLEGRGARVFLVTNAGFEDLIEIGRQNRPQLYALSGHRPPPLVRREDRIGIAGRLGPGGEVEAPLSEVELAGLLGRLGGGEALAVVLLHSYANPSHEEAVGEALAASGLPITLSSRILPEFREYERASTTVANAALAPLMRGYLERIDRALPQGRVRVMGSNGGALSIPRAVAEPVQTVLSGPAGGVVAALEWGRRIGKTRLLAFDMGGTSTDVSLIPGELLHTREGQVGGIPIAIPLLDIHTVGAGGGSIARLDPGGALRVGPESAGAHPGPIAYGMGGDSPTVTDANLWLGRLPEGGLLGGARPLDRGRLAAPMEALAREAGLTPDEVAEGILEVVNTTMEGALRVISIERGADPADFTLLAFGGAAGLHAAELAERLGLSGVLLPPHPGLLSAFGMLLAPVLVERQRTVLLSSQEPSTDRRLEARLHELEEAARAAAVEEGAPESELRVRHLIDARYQDQSFELRVPAEGWIRRFHEAHEERFGYRREGTPVEAVTLRVQVESPGAPFPPVETASDPESESPETTPVGWKGEWIEATLLPRAGLVEGRAYPGPAIVTEYSATTWCPPGWAVVRDATGALHLDRR